MATVNFYQAARMSSPYFFYGYVTAATSTQLTIDNFSGQYGTYYGRGFTYNSNSVTGGIVTAYDSYDNYSPYFNVSGVSVPALAVQAFLNNGDAIGLQQYGLSGADTINGSSFSDSLLGYAGNDVIRGGGGNDYIDGGLGLNTAVYSGVASAYSITLNGTNAATVNDLVAARDGTDTDINIQRLQFFDKNIALDIAPTQTAGAAYMLYQAAFNRTPDVAGLGYWIAQVDKGANIVTGVAQLFINSPEFIAKYGANPTNADYVDSLYQNVLHRSGDAGGVTYWNQQLNSGAATKAFVLEQFATLAEGAALVAPTIAHGIAYQQWVG